MNVLTIIGIIVLSNMLGFITSLGIMFFGNIKNGFFRAMANCAIIAALLAVSIFFPNHTSWFVVTALISLFGGLFSMSMCAVH